MAASLYVGNLDPDCTEANLYQIFSPIGNLLSVRLGKDKTTGRCLGYGFINYALKADAETAISVLNYSTVKGRSLRLMWSEKDLTKLPANANLFVKNLDFGIDEKALHVIFASYGDILSLKLATDGNGKSKGYAFIQYGDEKSADEAIKGVNEKMLYGQVVFVTRFMSKDKRLASSVVKFQNVYIKNFNSDVKDKDLIEICEKFGEIISAKVMKDDEGKSKCFGFVSFKNAESAEAAIKEMNGKMLNGRKLFAARAKKKLERQKEVTENLKRKFEGVVPEKNCLKPVEVR